MNAELLVVNVDAVALKVVHVKRAGTVTEVGTVRNSLLSDRPTNTPPSGAGSANVTVHVTLSPEARVEGLQPRLITPAGANKLRE
jgi:hypothetical protein